MKRCVFLAVLQVGLLLYPATRAVADDFPADAKEEIEQFRHEVARTNEDAAKKIAAKKADLIKRLQTLQTKYTKEGKLDEAVALRDYIRQLEGVFPAETNAFRGVARPVVEYRLCQTVQVEWGGTWWAAEVVKVSGNQYYIHYTGWSNSWDEWVPECRIRFCGPVGRSHRR